MKEVLLYPGTRYIVTDVRKEGLKTRIHVHALEMGKEFDQSKINWGSTKCPVKKSRAICRKKRTPVKKKVKKLKPVVKWSPWYDKEYKLWIIPKPQKNSKKSYAKKHRPKQKRGKQTNCQ